jgi:hypothetical protein
MNKFIRLILLKILGRSIYEKLLFILKNGYIPNLDNPSTFNEIIASRKINQPITEIQIVCSDKLKVRDYVREKIGDQYLTELYDVIKSPDELNTSNWPDQVVLKANHASGKLFVKVITNTSELNEKDTKQWIKFALSSDYGLITNEYWYNQIEQRVVIVEEKLNPDEADLRDYKFMMVNGELLFIQVDQGRFTNHTRNLYTSDWEKLHFSFGYPMGEFVQPPENLSTMIDLSHELASDFDLCRIDLYEDQFKRVKFGEITFSPDAGWGRFISKKNDLVMGKMLINYFNKE